MQERDSISCLCAPNSVEQALRLLCCKLSLTPGCEVLSRHRTPNLTNQGKFSLWRRSDGKPRLVSPVSLLWRFYWHHPPHDVRRDATTHHRVTRFSNRVDSLLHSQDRERWRQTVPNLFEFENSFFSDMMKQMTDMMVGHLEAPFNSAGAWKHCVIYVYHQVRVINISGILVSSFFSPNMFWPETRFIA